MGIKHGLKYKKVGDGYECLEDYVYCSPRYNKFICIPKGFYSDGATWAFDITTLGYWVHDYICRYGVWCDGTPVNNWQASTVLSDILREEGRPIRAQYWRIFTWLFGGGAARENGML